MNAEVITIGEEIISGQTIDTNSAFIGRKLSDIGIEVVWRVSCGDRAEDITAAILTAWNRSVVTIITGGLGPTCDDITKNAICAAFERKLVLQDTLLKMLEEKFRERNAKMPAIVQNQALQPQGAELIINPVGSAPGIVFQESERYFVALPGVPAEMEALMTIGVIPALKKRLGRKHIEIRRLRTVGITESGIAETIADLEPTGGILRLAYLPSYLGVDLRVTGRYSDVVEAKAQVDRLTQAIVSRIGKYIFTIGDQSMTEVVGELLIKAGKTLATAESCTGGLIAKLLTDIPGSSAFYVGSVVAYANSVKERVVGVPASLLEKHGAVSSQVAEAMARGVKDVTGADFGLSTTGIAGPSGGTVEKPVGLVYIACAGRDGVVSQRLNLFGTRQRIRERSAVTALDLLRRRLIGE
jgi:nicotinamide-nucleotide amidase